MSIIDGYTLGNGGYYRNSDMSGPYSIAPDGTVTLLGSGGSEGGQTDGLTDAQLRASALDTVPSMTSGGNIAVTVRAQSVALPSHDCRQITVSNSSDSDVSVSQSGVAFIVMARSYFTFFGLTNTNQLSLSSAIEAAVSVRWEV